MYCPRNAVCVISRTREIIHKEIRRKLPFYVSLNLVKHGGVFSFSFRWENNPKTTESLSFTYTANVRFKLRISQHRK